MTASQLFSPARTGRSTPPSPVRAKHCVTRISRTHRHRTPLAMILLLGAACVASACGPDGEEFCGLPAETPDESAVSDGNFAANFTTSTGDEVEFTERGSWGPGPSASIEAGLLSVIIARDETGTEVSELIERGAFPICVPLRDRSDTSGQANYVEGGFVTNNNAVGNLSILAREGDNIVGRFEALLENTQGEDLSFTDGSFRVPQR